MPNDLPGRSNLHGTVALADPGEVAVLIATEGWSIRKCGFAAYEVSGKSAELVVEAGSPVLVHGPSMDPAATADMLARIFRGAALEFSLEVYAEDGALVRTISA